MRRAALLLLPLVIAAGCGGPARTDAENAYLADVFDFSVTGAIPQDQLLAAGHQVCKDMANMASTGADGTALAKFHVMNSYGANPAQTDKVFTSATTKLCPAG